MLKKAIGNVAKKSSVSTAGDLCQKLKAIRVSNSVMSSPGASVWTFQVFCKFAWTKFD